MSLLQNWCRSAIIFKNLVITFCRQKLTYLEALAKYVADQANSLLADGIFWPALISISGK
jgi:hypothetical protein